jgi:Arc/MetJ family transcription regulator
MRTNIAIDDEFVREAMRLSGCKTERETVETALRLLLQTERQQAAGGAVERLAAFRGVLGGDAAEQLAAEREDWDR